MIPRHMIFKNPALRSFLVQRIYRTILKEHKVFFDQVVVNHFKSSIIPKFKEMKHNYQYRRISHFIQTTQELAENLIISNKKSDEFKRDIKKLLEVGYGKSNLFPGSKEKIDMIKLGRLEPFILSEEQKTYISEQCVKNPSMSIYYKIALSYPARLTKEEGIALKSPEESKLQIID
ncbi:unnamed protein product [Blepharisma stoltei]|uniref:LYR motif-containing protein Cup1-like N-terminal domain-containing protein n=1 Tax=Blepharisma stoltei TaxID=1481888 RepID=A0AAU9I9W0_9CILI|nr:unnamed protein product [Blepharisma stoltei]